MKELIDALQGEQGLLMQREPVKVSRGRVVITLGPWSNGHEEQCALVTNVNGSGIAGDSVNLFILVDQGQPIVTDQVPWYPSRREAEQALAADAEKANITGGAVCCYFPDKV